MDGASAAIAEMVSFALMWLAVDLWDAVSHCNRQQPFSGLTTLSQMLTQHNNLLFFYFLPFFTYYFSKRETFSTFSFVVTRFSSSFNHFFCANSVQYKVLILSNNCYIYRVVKCDVTKIKICELMGSRQNVSLPKISKLVQNVGEVLPQLCSNDLIQLLLKMVRFLT